MKPALLLLLTLALAGCGLHPRDMVAPSVATADPQLAHADGLLGGFTGRVVSQHGRLTLELVHQTPFAAPVPCDSVAIAAPDAAAETVLYLGADQQLYGAWNGRFYLLGSYAGTPAPGAPLRYDFSPGAHPTFAETHTTLTLPAAAQALGTAPALLNG